jgi:hypothetical protein
MLAGCGGGGSTPGPIATASPSPIVADGVSYSISQLSGSAVDTDAGNPVYPLIELNGSSASAQLAITSYGTVGSSGVPTVTELDLQVPSQASTAVTAFLDAQQRPTRILATSDRSAYAITYLANSQMLVQELNASGDVVASGIATTPTFPSSRARQPSSSRHVADASLDSVGTVVAVAQTMESVALVAAAIPGLQLAGLGLAIGGVVVLQNLQTFATALDTISAGLSTFSLINSSQAAETPYMSPTTLATITPPAQGPGCSADNTQILTFYAPGQSCGITYTLTDQNSVEESGTVTLSGGNPSIVSLSPTSGALETATNPGTRFLYLAGSVGGSTTVSVSELGTGGATSTLTVTVENLF